jgi:L-asparagine oxygenase
MGFRFKRPSRPKPSRVLSMKWERLSVRASRPGIERLIPYEANAARQRSLSRDHGLGMFPLHTDCAHWVAPPRWTIAWCETNAEQRCTPLLPWATLRAGVADRGPATLFVRNGHRSFFTTVGTQARIDGSCMVAQTPAARALLAAVGESVDASVMVSVEWRPGTILVLDNHRVLHGRGAPTADARGRPRVLWRALMTEGVEAR